MDAELVRETDFNSSPITNGVLFCATKPMISNIRERGKPREDSLSKDQEISELKHKEEIPQYEVSKKELPRKRT